MTDTDLLVTLPPFYLNQSRWKSFQDCDRLYAWLNVERITPATRKRYFAVGTAVHHAMTVVHDKGYDEKGFETAMSEAQEMYEKEVTKGPKLFDIEDSEVKEGRFEIRRLLRGYRRKYKESHWQPLGVELEFRVEVGVNTGVFLVGRIDNLCTFMGGLWLVDYKTMKRLNLLDFRRYEIDIQLTAYIYGGTRALTEQAKEKGEPPVMIRGAIIDGLVKTDPPQYHREMYQRTIQDLREFELEFVMKAWEIAAKHAMLEGNRELYDAYHERMWRHGREHGWKTIFPKNTNKCFQYGVCSHHDLCVKDTPERREAFVPWQDDYVDAARKESRK